MFKKFLAVFLSIMFVATAFPTGVSAGEKPQTPSEQLADIAMMIDFMLNKENEEDKKILDKLKTLNGDILMGEDTQNDKVKEINTGEEIALTGKLDVTPIKSLMGLLNPSNVKDSTQTVSVLELAKLTGVNSVFTAELTLPEGMLFSRKLTKDDVKFANAQDIFSVKEDPVIDGNSIKIKMVFDDPVMKAKEDYTIGDLLKALNKVGDIAPNNCTRN